MKGIMKIFMERKIFNLLEINRSLIFGILINVTSAFFNTAIPIYVRKFIDMSSQDNVDFKWLIIIFTLLFLQAILTSIGTFIITREGDRQIANIRLKVKKHLLELPTSFFEINNSGELSSRVINDATILRSFLTASTPRMVNGAITILVSTVILMILDWRLAFLLILIFPLDALITFPIGKINENISNQTQSRLSNLIGLASENFKNIRTVKLNNAENNVYSKFKKENDNLYKLSVESDKLFAIMEPVQRLFAIALIMVVILYGGFRVNSGSLTVGTLVSFIIYLFQLIGPINNVAAFYNNYKQTSGATEKIFSIMNTSTENRYEINSSVQNISKPHNLLLKNATFSYDSTDFLDNVTMSFKAGEKIAIVGPTGSGKSTIINLLTRLYPLEEGMLFLNEKDASEFKLDDWRGLFGVVSQENTIFSGSIFDNLIFGLNYQPTKEKVKNAIDAAFLSKEIERLPEGIHTIVGEQGVKLSGGQRQRIQIARAYLKKADFLILDEATSSLDSHSERVISDNLKHLMRGKTIISIAHRLSTVVDSDKIYFIEDNKIKAVGNHFELLKTVQTYKRFVEEQIIQTEKVN